ncbi:hypothetical protein [Vibrio rotiferianus]|uniref:hypothetical protein n=1 Tax=Vibrio rotiferianus TaxID=190895 RepID=UPI001110664E|nr:hypothetical protein [Vibrio rotiferianus]TMX64550.1 hypothetical protein DA097_12555 [Vibrio rotiferianus]
MALDSKKTTDRAVKKLEGFGFIVDGKFSRQREFIQAIVEAVIEDVKGDAEVNVTSGSSKGKWKIE